MNYGDWRRWLMILQLTFVANCMKKRDTTDKIVQACVGYQLRLSCNKTEEIEIIAVILGDSECFNALTKCCIKDSDCKDVASKEHVRDVKNTCNGKQSCTMTVQNEYVSKCSSLFRNDYERITYRCKFRSGSRPASLPSSKTTSTTRLTERGSTASWKTDDIDESSDSTPLPNDGTESDSHISQNVGPSIFVIILVTICIVISAIIVVLVIVIVRRRKMGPPVKYDMELSNAISSSGTEAVYANDNQPTANHSSNSQPGAATAANTTSIYDRPRSVVYSVVCKTDSMVQEDQTHLYCDVEEKDTDHPRDNVYSVLRNSGYVGHVSPDGDIYDDVETKENVKTSAVKHDTETYEEACEWKGQDTKKQKQGNGSTGVKLTAAGKAQNEFTKINNPLPSSSSKAFYMNTGEIAAESPSPVYEPMSAGVGSEGIYANEPVLSSPRSLSGRGSDTDSQYCAMQSPRVQLKDDGMQIVVDNELYGSK